MALTVKDLKSGVTAEYLERAKTISAQTIGHEVWLDKEGFWHEKLKDGSEVKYTKEQAYVQMRTGVKDDPKAPDYMRIDGAWLRIDGIWVAPMILIGYTSGSTSTSHVVYGARWTKKDDPSIPEGKHVIYTETLLVTHDNRLAVHVSHTMFNTDAGTLVKEHCWSDFVYL